MLGGIFQKRKKIQELRSPSLQDIKKFRDAYAKHADQWHVETPSCFEKSIYKAISCQKELHSVDFRQEDITDPQVIALAEALVEMPMISTLDLRDNRITDDGAKAILEVMRLQIIAAKIPVKTDPKTKKPIHPVVPEYTKYVTSVNLKGNEISAHIFQEITQYTDILKREDKRLEIRAALSHIYLDGAGGIDEEEFKAVLKLLTGTEPSKKDVRLLMQQHTLSNDRAPSANSLENLLLAKCSSSPSKKAACPPWEALVQVRYATLGMRSPTVMSPTSQPGDSAKSTPSNAHSIRSAQVKSTTPVVGAKAGPSSDDPDIQSSSCTSSMQRPAVVSIQHVSPTKPPESPPHVAKSFASPTLSQLQVNEFRPPSSPPPPVPILMKPSPVSSEHQTSSASTPRAFNGSAINNDAAGDTPRVLSKPASVTSTVPIASSSPYPAAAESPRADISAPIQPPKTEPTTRVLTSAGLSASALAGKDAEGKQDVGLSSRKTSHHSTPSSSSELPPWKDDNVFTDSEEDSSNGDSHDDSNDSAAGDMSAKVDTHNGSAMNGSRAPSACLSDNRPATAHRRMDSGTFASEIVELSDGEADDTTSPSKMTEGYYSNIHSQYESKEEIDLSSLVYCGNIIESNTKTNEHRQSAASNGSDQSAASKSKLTDDEEPENDDAGDVLERVEYALADVLKDGKQRSIAKLIHSEFRRGMVLTDFPDEIPFRNLVVLLLSENGLTELSLMKTCRFPCTLALDLSSNKLSKLADDDLAPFPKLQILNLAQNQIKSIQGLGKVFDLKALNLSRNAIKSVKNIEHLLSLEILAMNNNAITSMPALRLLSMNKVLAHLDLDGNPIVETDERQRRKNVANLLNLLPTLRSLGSIPCVSLQSKEKKMSQLSTTKPGKRLLDVEQLPNFQDLWVSYACDALKFHQDDEIQRRNNDDDDEWGTERDDDVAADRPRKVLSREVQRQRDELRSRAIAFRSRGKAAPSPPKQKSSAYSFGPPLPPPPPKKKAPTADRSTVLKQQRRSSELSAPKHPPVDTALLQQEKKRKSRPAFDINMSVAERLQLTKDKAQRSNSMAGCKTIGPRKSTTSGGIHQAKRVSATQNNEQPQAITSDSSIETQPSPRPATPMKILIGKDNGDVVEFRIEPLRVSSARAPESKSPVKPQQSTPVRAKEVSPIQVKPETPAKVIAPPEVPEMKPAAVIENNFLHSLAVADFLNHAEEEFSTAVTALTVLLSMSEKANGDPNKLLGYRRSLAALDILNECESHALYNKVKGYGDTAQAADCDSAFERLSVVKKCLKQLLEHLDVDAPGSSQIRAFCKSLRTTELRSIVPSESNDGDASESVKETALTSVTNEQGSAKSSNTAEEFCSSDSIEVPVVESYLSSNDEESPHPEGENITDTAPDYNGEIDRNEEASALGNEFDFLSTNEFDSSSDTLVTEAESAPSAVEEEPASDPFDESPSNVESTSNVYDDADVSTISTDITQDIQNMDDASVFDTDDSPFDDYENAVNALESEDKPADETQENSFDEQVEFESNEFDEVVFSEGDLESEGVINEQCALGGEQDPTDFVPEVEAEGDVFDAQADPIADMEETPKKNEFETDGEMETEYEHEDNTLADVQETIESEHEYEAESEEASQEEDQEASQEVYEHEAPQETAEVDYEETEPQGEAVEAEDEDDEEAEMFGDWEKGFDPSSNHYFWFNHASGESSWVPPEGWPYEVDAPFEEEETEEGGEDEYVQEEAAASYEEPSNEDDETAWMNEDGDQDGSAVGRQDTTNSECDDDLFSDHDLPEF